MPIKTDHLGYFEEYKFVWAEIVKRVELGQNILNIVFVSAVGIWGAATAYGFNTLFGIYPCLLLILALAYCGNARILHTLGHYMREVLEKEIYELCWASFFHKINRHDILLNRFFVYCIFIIPSILSLFLYYYRAGLTIPGDRLDRFFFLGLVCALIAIIIIWFTFRSNYTSYYSLIKEIKAKKLKGANLVSISDLNENPQNFNQAGILISSNNSASSTKLKEIESEKISKELDLPENS